MIECFEIEEVAARLRPPAPLPPRSAGPIAPDGQRPCENARGLRPPPAPAAGRRGAAPCAGAHPRARRTARSRCWRTCPGHRDRGARQPRSAARHRLRHAARRRRCAGSGQALHRAAGYLPRPARPRRSTCSDGADDPLRRRYLASTQVDRIEALLHDPRVARDLDPKRRRTGPPQGLRAMARKRAGEPVNGWLVIDKPVGHDLDPGGRRGAAPLRCRQGRPWRHARSRWPPACCRSRSARRPRPSPTSWTAGRPTASPCAGARRAPPTTPRARSPPPATGGRRTAEILAALPGFIGEIEQVPPAFSAIKVEGERAYDLARAGETVELAPRRIAIDAFAPRRDGRRRPRQLRGQFAARAPICGRWAATWR